MFPPKLYKLPVSFFLPSPLLAQFVSDWILVVNGIYSRIGTPHTHKMQEGNGLKFLRDSFPDLNESDDKRVGHPPHL